MKPIKSILLIISFFLLISCDKNDEELLPDIEPTDYCVMFYCSGGDEAHDLSFMSTIESAAAVTKPEVAVTSLFKFSCNGEGETHNGIRRYKADNGSLTIDDSFVAQEDFDITDSENLSKFIKWSAETFPDRKYILVLVGHGLRLLLTAISRKTFPVPLLQMAIK